MGLGLLSRWAAVAILAGAVLPASALGADVSVTAGVVTVRDTAGVINQISIEPWSHDTDGILVTETGPTLLTAGGGCILWDEDILHPRGDKVFCAGQFFERIVVDGGGGDDAISYGVEFSAGVLLGGAGDDVVTAWVG